MEYKRVLSGIKPTGGALHIGNYFGAVKQQIELQETAQAYYFVADLHALNLVKDSRELRSNIENVVLDYLALGLDSEKCVFFRQSDVVEHSMLAVVLGNYVPYSLMKRMHAFKDKKAKAGGEESVNMGLFSYPVLMAADILLYKADGVPVGEDQRQHIEVTRDIALSFNKTYKKETFRVPEALILKDGGRIKGTDGVKKMSKSLGNVIDIFAPMEVIKTQIMSCYTDPSRVHATDPGKIEGNMVFEYHDLLNDDKAEVADLKERYQKGQVGDVEVKNRLLEAHKRFFASFRERREELVSKPEMVERILREGAEKARAVASETMREVYEVIGLSK